MHFDRSKSIKIRLRPGLCRGQAEEAYSAPTDSYAGFGKGKLLRRGEEENGYGKWRENERKRKGR